MDNDGFFKESDVISSYTREQAIADGVLVDVTQDALTLDGTNGRQVCITAAVFGLLQQEPDPAARRIDLLTTALGVFVAGQDAQGDDGLAEFFAPLAGHPSLWVAWNEYEGLTVMLPSDY